MLVFDVGEVTDNLESHVVSFLNDLSLVSFLVHHFLFFQRNLLRILGVHLIVVGLLFLSSESLNLLLHENLLFGQVLLFLCRSLSFNKDFLLISAHKSFLFLTVDLAIFLIIEWLDLQILVNLVVIDAFGIWSLASEDFAERTFSVDLIRVEDILVNHHLSFNFNIFY